MGRGVSALAHQATCVMIDGRGVLIEGAPGTGKSSLALSLIDRGATLVGDDGVLLKAIGGALCVDPHPAIAGKLEVRNLGLVDMPVAHDVPVALVIVLDPAASRFIETAEVTERAGVPVPLVRLWPDAAALPLRAELALRLYGLC